MRWDSSTSSSSTDPIGIRVSNRAICLLFPNPVNSTFTLSGLNLEKVEIYSINGKLIRSISLNTINSVDVSDLEKGAYILKVTSNNKVGITRFIKQ